MTFDEYWVEVGKKGVLPQMALKQLPSSLSESAKKRLMKRPTEETVKLLSAVIDQVNR